MTDYSRTRYLLDLNVLLRILRYICISLCPWPYGTTVQMSLYLFTDHHDTLLLKLRHDTSNSCTILFLFSVLCSLPRCELSES